jgi:hypothetical protein
MTPYTGDRARNWDLERQASSGSSLTVQSFEQIGKRPRGAVGQQTLGFAFAHQKLDEQRGALHAGWFVRRLRSVEMH